MLAARVERLEKQMGALNKRGLLVVVQCGPDRAELDALLAEKGIDPDHPNHTVVILQNIFEDKDDGIAPLQLPAKILSVTEQK